MSATGQVYDRGYRPYEGTLGGRRASVIALWRMSVRRALGLRRSWRQKLLPWLLLAVVSVPAIVNVGIAYLTRDTPADGIEVLTFYEYAGVSTAMLVFVAVTAPDVICPDRRNRTLPLLFARPITGLDYVIAKVAAIASIVFAFAVIPQLVLFLGQLLVSEAALTYFGDNAAALWQVPVSAAVLALYCASLAVAIASYSTRRLIGAAVFLILLLVTSVMAGIFVGASINGNTRLAAVNLITIPLYVRDLVFLGEVNERSSLSGVPGAGATAVGVYLLVVGTSWIALWRRYRWVDV